MPYTSADIPVLAGSTAVVTGANAGLGLETARALAGAGATVVMAARDVAKARTASDRILDEHPGATTDIVALDLADLASVRVTAEQILASHDSIEILVDNAGVMGIPERTSVDGYEMQFAVNHLGHFALTGLLWPALAAGDGARVVTVSSFARNFRGRFDPDDPPLKGAYNPWTAYGQSKMANLRFALELDRRARAAGAPVAAVSCHPGLSHTGLQYTSAREAGGWSQRFWAWAAPRFGMSRERGARIVIRAATDPSARGGDFFAPRWYVKGAAVRRPLMPWTRRSRANRTLWEVSERLTGVRFLSHR